MDINRFSEIKLEDYQYNLPPERIAKYPLAQRDHSQLLIWKEGQIKHETFKNIPNYLNDEYQLYFNNTKVVPARIYFQKPSGATIEIFLLTPYAPTPIISEAMLIQGSITWSCTIGNLKRWKGDLVLSSQIEVGSQKVILKATLEDRASMRVRFEWDDATLPFVDIISNIGETPLPPYIERATTEEDKITYQTVYSKKEGAVAAPTAGLHFTNEVLTQLQEKGITTHELTLHVGAGTFQPIKVDKVYEHDMHHEEIIITRKNLEDLLKSKKIIATGTTSLRTLESLYWHGVNLYKNPDVFEAPPAVPFIVEKLAPYQYEKEELPDRNTAFKTVYEHMQKHEVEELIGQTSIFVFPGYTFQVVDALITNFHLPSTTLILLIAAFVGEDWREIYQQALDNDYRFLSYGDSSLLFRKS